MYSLDLQGLGTSDVGERASGSGAGNDALNFRDGDSGLGGVGARPSGRHQRLLLEECAKSSDRGLRFGS
jgi:hypothetical protein